MFQTLNDVPVQIREFYEEDVRSEPTGNTIDVPYTYEDEEGNKQQAVRPEPEYADVTYIVLKPFGEIQHNVEVLLANNSDLELVNRFIGFENNGIDKSYHDKFLAWYNDEPMQDDEEFYVYENPEIDDSMIYSQDLFNAAHQDWQSEEPVRDPHKTLEDYPAHKSYLKLRGVEFEGVLCSATKEDFWGLSAAEAWIRAGNSSVWEFHNGNKLELTKDNIDAFYAVWVSFRLSFFATD